MARQLVRLHDITDETDVDAFAEALVKQVNKMLEKSRLDKRSRSDENDPKPTEEPCHGPSESTRRESFPNTPWEHRHGNEASHRVQSIK